MFSVLSELYWKWKVDGDTQMIWTAVNLWVFTEHQCSSQSPAALCWYHSFCTTQQAQCAPKCLHIRVIELWISIGSKFCPISKCVSDYIMCTKKKKKKKSVYVTINYHDHDSIAYHYCTVMFVLCVYLCAPCPFCRIHHACIRRSALYTGWFEGAGSEGVEGRLGVKETEKAAGKVSGVRRGSGKRLRCPDDPARIYSSLGACITFRYTDVTYGFVCPVHSFYTGWCKEHCNHKGSVVRL